MKLSLSVYIFSIKCSDRVGKSLKSICCSTFCQYKFKFHFEATVKVYMLRLALSQGPGLTYIAIAASVSTFIFLQINELSICTTKPSSFNSTILTTKQRSNMAKQPTFVKTFMFQLEKLRITMLWLRHGFGVLNLGLEQRRL